MTTTSDAPDDVQETPAPAPDPIPADDGQDYDDATHHDDAPDDSEAPGGIPAAHMAVGGATGGTVGLGLLYQLTGIPGLIAGGALAAAGTVAYVRHRRGAGSRPGTGSVWGLGSTSRSSKSGKTTMGSLLGGRSRTGSGTSALFSTGRASGRSGSRSGRSGLLGGKAGHARGMGSPSAASAGQAAARAARSAIRADRTGRRAAGTTSRSSRAASSGGPVRQAAEKVRQATTKTATAARGTARAARQAAAWANTKTGGRAGRAARAGLHAAATAARRAAVYADRKTGRRVSTAYRAATTGKDASFRARRRRAAAILGWHGPVTGPVLALVAVLAEAWKRRKARKAQAAEAASSETTTPETTPETSEASKETEGPETVVHGKTGNPAVTATATCPRCGARRTAELAADADEVTVTCDCGYRIRFVRIPPDDPATTSTAEAGPRHRRPSTTSTPYTRRSRTMSANPLAAAAAEMTAAAAAHAPADMFAVARELDQLHEVPAHVGMSIRTYTVRLQGEYPIHPAVVEALAELYMSHAALVERAQEIAALFRNVHAEDLKREEAPRTNEAAWNV